MSNFGEQNALPAIPFNRPWLSGSEIKYLRQALEARDLSGDGSFSLRCQEFMEERFGAKKVLLTTSCTSALEMAALLLEVGPEDEIILPSFTFVSTANAFHLRGAKLRFVDIEPNALNINPEKVAEAITDRTKVIVPVHYAGIGCDMDRIMVLAKDRNINVVEDAAQGVDATRAEQYLGTIGDIGTFSFHETKNFVCGEGGAIVINRDDLIERAEILREKGTNRSQFFRGEVEKYTWVDLGSSYLPSDLLAAVLMAQFEAIDEITEKRGFAYRYYDEHLAPLEERGLLRRPIIPPHCKPNYHMYYILVENLDTRIQLIEFLKERSIMAVFHYVPLHSSPVGQSLGYKEGMLPLTENISERLLRLPMFAGLLEDDLNRVTSAIQEFFG